MKQIIKKVSLPVIVSFAISMSIALPVIANAQADKDKGRPTEVSERIEKRKSAAKAAVAEKRESAKEKSSEARQSACEKRQQKIEASIARISKQATRHVATFDAIYERVQGFYDKGQLTVHNYDELNAAVSNAQATATLEAAVLGEVDSGINCEDPNVAETVATYRTSASAAKESLKAYRSALVELISSLRAEAAEQKQQDSSQDEEETENEQEVETNEQEELEGASQ